MSGGPAQGAGRREIGGLLRGGIEPVRVVKRAQVLRPLNQGTGPPQVASVLGVSPQTVRNVGWRYAEDGLERALHEKSRPDHQPALSPRQARRIVAVVCGPPPEGQARWSVRLAEQGPPGRARLYPVRGPGSRSADVASVREWARHAHRRAGVAGRRDTTHYDTGFVLIC